MGSLSLAIQEDRRFFCSRFQLHTKTGKKEITIRHLLTAYFRDRVWVRLTVMSDLKKYMQRQDPWNIFTDAAFHKQYQKLLPHLALWAGRKMSYIAWASMAGIFYWNGLRESFADSSVQSCIQPPGWRIPISICQHRRIYCRLVKIHICRIVKKWECYFSLPEF